MKDGTIPQALLEKHPELIQVMETLAAYREGRPITARCPKCSQLLTVTDLPDIASRWVTCAQSCTSYHEKYSSYAGNLLSQ
jgi:hypothetical protein